MGKYRMLVQYLGTQYHGWQTQKNRPTIQSELQQALQQITGKRVSVVGAGRTDSGVHALGQVAHFRLEKTVDANHLHRAMNGVLPWDIRVRKLRRTDPDFHAQRHAVRKRYDYRIFNGPVLPPFLWNQVVHVRKPLNPRRLSEAARHVLGTHDFSAFAASGTAVQTRVRTITKSLWVKKGCHLNYRIVGSGFLHHMVRNIVGTLLEVGVGKRLPEDLIRVLQSQDRSNAGPTAPPHGLYLVKVWYGP